MGLEEYADHLAGWLESRSAAGVVILGHSMGGVVGLILCERRPDLVGAFINVEGNLSMEDCRYSGMAAAYSLEEFLEKGFETLYDAVYHDGLEEKALRTYYASLRKCDPRVFHLDSTRLVELCGTEELAARFAALEVPHLYVLGAPDGAGEKSQSLLTAVGESWCALEEAGHWPFIDQQDAFVDEVLAFLNGLPWGGKPGPKE